MRTSPKTATPSTGPRWKCGWRTNPCAGTPPSLRPPRRWFTIEFLRGAKRFPSTPSGTSTLGLVSCSAGHRRLRLRSSGRISLSKLVHHGPPLSHALAVNLAVSRRPPNRQRGRGLAGNQALREAAGWRAGGQRPPSHPQLRRHEHTQVTWSLPTGKRRHPLLGACSHRGRWRNCRAARKGSLGSGAAGRWPPKALMQSTDA
jgi:hypothetical protein